MVTLATFCHNVAISLLLPAGTAEPTKQPSGPIGAPTWTSKSVTNTVVQETAGPYEN